MKLKYYSGAQVFDIIKELPDKEFLAMLNAFAKEPSADVVEVVRCKDCKFRGHIQLCPFGKRGMPHENGYCCYGERRTDVENEEVDITKMRVNVEETWI